MALQDLPNKQGFFLHADNNLTHVNLSGTTLDAANEKRSVVGKVYLEAGSGSKTISSAGGKIRWRSGGSAVFANAGTTIRIGIQDVGTNGYEDGTFDVYDDLVGGTDTINSSADQLTTMSSGTKTITHGDVIAVTFEMISKGGSDSVQFIGMATAPLTRNNGIQNFPYITTNTGSPAKTNAGVTCCAIEFDDGTLGWIAPGIIAPGQFNSAVFTYNSGSSPDEYAAVFELPFRCRISGGYINIGSISSTDNFEIILYSDPKGTPTVIETITVDPDFAGSGSTASYFFTFATARVLSANTFYGIAVRPTTANSISFNYGDLTSGNDKYKKPFPFGSTLEIMGRTNQTGAFSTTQVYYMPYFGIMIDQLDDGAGGGGEVSHVF